MPSPNPIIQELITKIPTPQELNVEEAQSAGAQAIVLTNELVEFIRMNYDGGPISLIPKARFRPSVFAKVKQAFKASGWQLDAVDNGITIAEAR